MINGKNDGLDSFLKDAKVTFELNKIASAKFNFVATNPDTDKKDKQPLDLLKENDELTFNVFSTKVKKVMFKGAIKSIEKAHDGSNISAKVECKDIAYLLTLSSAERETNNQTFDDKLQLFAKKMKLGDNLSAQAWGKEKITHNTATLPWDYILGFLDSIGMMVAVRNGEFNGVDILQPDTDEKYAAENGINVFAFSGRSDDSKKIKKASIEHWDAASQKVKKTDFEQEARNAITKTVTLNECRLSEATLQRMVRTILKKSQLQTITGKIMTFGNLEAKAGEYIKCNKVNDKIDNILLLINTEQHSIENGLWKTEYSFGLDAETTFAETANKQTSTPQAQTGQTNSINGLQIGVVTQIDGDPNNEHRIKIRIPTLSENGEGVWARLATLSASKEMGSFFIPDVGDEVIVGCLGNNPDTPVVLGCLYSSANKMPFEIKKENHLKGFVTKEGTKVILDDEKKCIELSTKNGNKILLSDDEKGIVLEDENRNKITMNKDGISIESSKDITIKATGNLQAEGMQTTVKASAMMELKGSIIKLN